MVGTVGAQTDAPAARPNVVLVMTDDQGFGDFGFAGNPVIRTPHLDALARASARLTAFYVSPVCTPTRAALMTGRWCQRTRAFDTYIGRAMMEPDEVTVAEILRAAGYATGIFGKWHLGDCHPLRASDQGFEETLVLRGGGIGQPSDPVGGERRYTDPVLFRNGAREQANGYCTDVFFAAALRWMATCRAAGRPFFCYLPTNAPHGPFGDVPEDLRERYAKEGVGAERFPATPGWPAKERVDADVLARTYAMIENVDANVGRLVDGLRALGCLDDTLVVFLCDNGPEGRRWVAGYRGSKGDVYEGGIRSPLWAHWPSRLQPGDASDRITAHVDLMPTILEACGVAAPASVRLDGRSVLGLLERRDAPWPDRTLVIQANRGDVPVRYHHFALRTQRWKLVNPTGFWRELDAPPPLRPELYDMVEDPFEQHDVAAQHQDVVAELSARYDAWFDDVAATRSDAFAPPRIFVGSEAELVTVLTRQDWRRVAGQGWGAQGEWLVDVRRAGEYLATVRMPRGREATRGVLRCGDVTAEFELTREAAHAEFALDLPAGPAALRVTLADTKGEYGAYQVEVRRSP